MKGLPFAFRRNMVERLKLTEKKIGIVLSTSLSVLCGWEMLPDVLHREESIGDNFRAALRIRIKPAFPELTIGDSAGMELEFCSDIRCILDNVEMNSIKPFMTVRMFCGTIPTILKNDSAVNERIEAFFDRYLTRPGISEAVWEHLVYMLKVRNFLIINARCVVLEETDLTMRVNATLPGRDGYIAVTWDFERAIDDLATTGQYPASTT